MDIEATDIGWLEYFEWLQALLGAPLQVESSLRGRLEPSRVGMHFRQIPIEGVFASSRDVIDLDFDDETGRIAPPAGAPPRDDPEAPD